MTHTKSVSSELFFKSFIVVIIRSLFTTFSPAFAFTPHSNSHNHSRLLLLFHRLSKFFPWCFWVFNVNWKRNGISWKSFLEKQTHLLDKYSQDFLLNNYVSSLSVFGIMGYTAAVKRENLNYYNF